MKWVAVLLISFLALSLSALGKAIVLPIEVAGPIGTVGTVTLTLDGTKANQVRAFSMQVHGLEYPGMASVRINDSLWWRLTNESVTVAEPGRSYGGIGGGFATLKMTLTLDRGIVVPGENVFRFRFDRSNGVVSGFRVLAFNLLDEKGNLLLQPDTFVSEDPNTWSAPLKGVSSLTAGARLWKSAELNANSFPGASAIKAHCGDCHLADGRDLKYFNYSNRSIIARAQFHGLSELEGEQIASYIRTLNSPNPGRPWNPPYQPGPGLDAQPVGNWAAGAGLNSVLDEDLDSLPFIFPQDATSDQMKAVFRPDASLNAREIPIDVQLPDWNHWLPRVHPLDAWGPVFLHSRLLARFNELESDLGKSSAAAKPDLRTRFETWHEAQRAFLKPLLEHKSVEWSADLAEQVYATELWQLVKTWELTQKFGLEQGAGPYSDATPPRTWKNSIPAETAPAAAGIPSTSAGMGGSALSNEYFNSAWYELQIILSSGDHRHHNLIPVDWVYVIGRFLELYKESHRPEASRLLIAIIKASQSSDPKLGPANYVEGWRPERSVDPRIMVAPEWAPMLQTLSQLEKRKITEAFLAAWMEKNLQFTTAQFFARNVKEHSYQLPTGFGRISGGKVWEDAPMFAAAGVNEDLIYRLRQWGKAYRDTADRFQY